MYFAFSVSNKETCEFHLVELVVHYFHFRSNRTSINTTMADIFNREYIKDAASLIHNVNDSHFSPTFAIFAITNDKDLAFDETSIKATETILCSFAQGKGRIIDKKELCGYIWNTVKKLPNLSKKKIFELCLEDFREKKLVDVMRLVGYPTSDTTGSSTVYMRIKRYIAKIPSTIDVDHLATSTSVVSLQSPVSMLSSPSTASSVTHGTSFSGCTLASKSSSSDSSHGVTTITTRTKSCSTSAADLLKLTTLPQKRRTVTEAQNKRALDIALKDSFSLAYKVGSIILHDVRRKNLPLKAFNTSVKVAAHVNELFGMELLVGDEINRCVAANKAGQSPTRQGPPRKISDSDFELICELVFTCSSIEQANGDPNRLTRAKMQYAICEMINKKLIEDGADGLQSIAFYRRVEIELARHVTLESPDYREALRAAWTTWENQKMNYEQWEYHCVELGFGRYPKDEREQADHGNVVFYEGQQRRIIQFDEMGFSFDGSKNGKGGRPAALSINPTVPDPKQPTSKSSQKITCMFAMNYENEAIPPMFVITSKAQKKGNSLVKRRTCSLDEDIDDSLFTSNT